MDCSLPESSVHGILRARYWCPGVDCIFLLQGIFLTLVSHIAGRRFTVRATREAQFQNAAAKSLQSCPTLCDPIDGSPPGSPVLGILQARTLEWVAVSFSNARKWNVKVKSLSRVRLFVTPWTAAYQSPPSMGFSRQEYWSWVPSPSPSFRMVCCKYLTNMTTSPLPVILLIACDERVKSACIQEIHNPVGRRDTLASLTCISSQVWQYWGLNAVPLNLILVLTLSLDQCWEKQNSSMHIFVKKY